MGNQSSYSTIQESFDNQLHRVTVHQYHNPTQLQNIFKLFTVAPFNYIDQVELEKSSSAFCDQTVVRTMAPRHKFNLQNLAMIKRSQKQNFVERQLWYFIKIVTSAMAYMQAHNVVLGVMNLRTFELQDGRFVKLQVLHLLPNNQHINAIEINNYYSPEMLMFFSEQIQLKDFNLFKSEVFSFGLLLLELASCPFAKPKFHKTDLQQIIWSQVMKRFKTVQEQRSIKLIELIGMMLREDLHTRPDWNYLKIWIQRHQADIDSAPCFFWSI